MAQYTLSTKAVPIYRSNIGIRSGAIISSIGTGSIAPILGHSMARYHFSESYARPLFHTYSKSIHVVGCSWWEVIASGELGDLDIY